MPRIVFKNNGNATMQIAITVDDTGIRNFQLRAGEQDGASTAQQGQTVWFWWRDDGNHCVQCADRPPPCSRNEFVMPANDVGIQLPDPRWPKQTL